MELDGGFKDSAWRQGSIVVELASCFLSGFGPELLEEA
jgi:hypothetical protein